MKREQQLKRMEGVCPISSGVLVGRISMQMVLFFGAKNQRKNGEAIFLVELS